MSYTVSSGYEAEYIISDLQELNKDDKELQIGYWTWLVVTLNNFLFFFPTLDFIMKFILKQWYTYEKSERPLI